jgi:hypothetical protein
MQHSQSARLASKLAFLGPSSRQQLLRYLDAQAARQYATGTLKASVTVVKRLLKRTRLSDTC